MIRLLLVLLQLFLLTNAHSQTFYVSCPVNVPVEKKAFQLSTTDCTPVQMFVCPPTNDTFQFPENQFLDIAMDKNQNLYYVSGGGGSLYKRSLNDTTSCQFLGTFFSGMVALVADSDDLIYGCTQVNGICGLYRYRISSGVFDTVGILPTGLYAAGDLFFYEGWLFLTGTTPTYTASYLAEIDIDDPSQSCYYMGLENLQPWSAFSINYGAYSKAYVLSTITDTSSALIELDIENKTIGNPICTYPFLAGGAATYYNLTASSSNVCDTNNTAINSNLLGIIFSIQNPVSDYIQIRANTDDVQIENLTLFNAFGKQVKHYSNENFKANLDVSDIPPVRILFDL